MSLFQSTPRGGHETHAGSVKVVTRFMRPKTSKKLTGLLLVKTKTESFQVTPKSPIVARIAVAPAATIRDEWITLAVSMLLRVPTSCLPDMTNQVLLGSFELSHDANLLHNNLINGIFDEFMKNLFKFVDGNNFVVLRHLLDHNFVGLGGMGELFAWHHFIVFSRDRWHGVFLRSSLTRHERGFGDGPWLLGYHWPRSMVMLRVSHGLS